MGPIVVGRPASTGPSREMSVAAAEQTQTSLRLAPQQGEAIDRSTPFTFKFDGRDVPAFPGDTIASAIAASGTKVFSRSFKYHRPRGLLCCSGHCPNCMVSVGNEPNVRACREPAAPGLQVTHQNAWPSLEADVMSLTEMGDRFLLSHGHYAIAFYAALIEAGIVDESDVVGCGVSGRACPVLGEAGDC